MPEQTLTVVRRTPVLAISPPPLTVVARRPTPALFEPSDPFTGPILSRPTTPPPRTGLSPLAQTDPLRTRFDPTVGQRPVVDQLPIETPRLRAGTPEESFLRRVADLGLTAVKAAITVPESAVGLADIVTGGRVGKVAEEYLGFSPKQARVYLDSYLSEKQRLANLSVDEAEGLVETAVAALKNPSVVAHTTLESLPLMIGGSAGIARQLVKRGLAPAVAAAVGEGAVTAGQLAEQTRQESEGGRLRAPQAGAAVAAGALTSGLALFGARVADKLGIVDIDTMLAAGFKNSTARTNLVRAVAAGALEEGFLEELPQSVQEQVWQNLANGKPIEEGLDQSAVLGALAGAVLGGGAQAIQPLTARTRQVAPADRVAPQTAPTAGPVAAPAAIVAPPDVGVTLRPSAPLGPVEAPPRPGPAVLPPVVEPSLAAGAPVSAPAAAPAEPLTVVSRIPVPGPEFVPVGEEPPVPAAPPSVRPSTDITQQILDKMARGESLGTIERRKDFEERTRVDAAREAARTAAPEPLEAVSRTAPAAEAPEVVSATEPIRIGEAVEATRKDGTVVRGTLFGRGKEAVSVKTEEGKFVRVDPATLRRRTAPVPSRAEPPEAEAATKGPAPLVKEAPESAPQRWKRSASPLERRIIYTPGNLIRGGRDRVVSYQDPEPGRWSVTVEDVKTGEQRTHATAPEVLKSMKPPPAARLAIRESEYRGSQGFTVSGRDHRDRSVSIFVETRAAAERVKARIGEGGEVTREDMRLGMPAEAAVSAPLATPAAPAHVSRTREAVAAETPAEAAAEVRAEVRRVIETQGARSAGDVQQRVVAALEAELLAATEAAGFTEITFDPRKAYGGREGFVVVDGRRVASLSLNRGDGPGALKGQDDPFEYPQELGTIEAGTPSEMQRAAVASVAKILADTRKAGVLKVEIPGDGTFTIERNPHAIREVIRRIKAGGPSPWKGLSGFKPQPGQRPAALATEAQTKIEAQEPTAASPGASAGRYADIPDLVQRLRDVLPQAAKIQGGVRIGADPEALGRVLGSSLYQGDFANIATKELLQNAFDAVRGVPDGRVVVRFLREKDTDYEIIGVEVQDNGRGMSREDLETVFTDLGSSGKREQAIATGGFGLAKAAPLLGGRRVTVESVSARPPSWKPWTQRQRHAFAGTPEELLRGVTVTSTDTKDATGTTVRVEFPKSTAPWSVTRYLENLANSSPQLPGELVTIGGGLRWTAHEEETLPRFDATAFHPPERLEEIPGARLTLWIAKQMTLSYGMPVTVANNGVFQHSGPGVSVGMLQLLYPDRAIVDIEPTVAEGDPAYPFTANREHLRDAVSKALSDKLQKRIGQPAKQAALAESVALYERAEPLTLPNGRPWHLLDVSGEAAASEFADPAFRELAQAVDEAITAVLAAFPTSPISLARRGFVFGENVHGLFLRDPRDPSQMALYVNPFGWLTTIAQTPDVAAAGLLHTIVHEAVHGIVGAHTEEFTIALSKTYASLGVARYSELSLELREIYANPDKPDRFREEIARLLERYRVTRRPQVGEASVLARMGVFARSESPRGSTSGTRRDVSQSRRGERALDPIVLERLINLFRAYRGQGVGTAAEASARLQGDVGKSANALQRYINEAWTAVVAPVGGLTAGASVGRYAEQVGIAGQGAKPPGTATVTSTTIRPIEFPELVDLAREILKVPRIVKKFRKDSAMGRFAGARGIALKAELFTKGQETQLAATIAHEIGHTVDWLPDFVDKRGNLLGRLRTLRRFLKGKFTKPDGTVIENKVIRKELQALSDAWRPWDPAKVSAGFKAYRHSSSELYADAISVLLNDPARLKAEAPTFYREFFDGLDEKPEVKRAFFELQEVLSGTHEELVARRLAADREMYRLGDTKAVDLHELKERERQWSARDYWFKLRTEYVDKHTRVGDVLAKLKKQGVMVPPDENPHYYLRTWNFIGAKMQAVVKEWVQPVYERVRTTGVAWSDVGLQAQYERIIDGDRSEVGNPGGRSPAVAKELRAAMRAGYNAQQLKVLDDAVHRLRNEWMQDEILDELHEVGLIKDERYAEAKKNPAYVPFRVIEHMEDSVSWRFYKQVGTLKDISNPMDALILKALASIRAIERQKKVTATLTFLERFDPASVEQAKERWTGKGLEPVEPDDPKKALAYYFENGRVRAKVVPQDVADSLNNLSVGSTSAVLRVMRLLNGAWFRPVFTVANLGFQTFNLPRDFWRTWASTKGLTLREALRQYHGARHLARVRAFGLKKDATPTQRAAYADLIEAEKYGFLDVTYNDVIFGHETAPEQEIEVIMSKAGVGTFTPGAKAVWSRVPKAVYQWIIDVGDYVETLPKAAAIYHYAALHGTISDIPPDVRDFIQRKVGSPLFKEGGTHTSISNNLLLFSNAMVQGLRADIEVGTGKETRGEFWWKNAKLAIVPALLTWAFIWLADHGDEDEPKTWVGRALKNISEYDLANYICLPLAMTDRGETVYIRVPMSDFGRLLHGMMWKLLNAGQNPDVIRAAMDIADYSAGQLPSLSPYLEVPGDVSQFLAGGQVYDPFRGRFLLTEQETKARDWRTFKKFIGYEFQKVGGGIVWKFYPGEARPREASTAQKILEAPVVSNILGRWIKIGNYGQTERLRKAAGPVARDEARRVLNEAHYVNEAVADYLKLAPDQRTPARAQQLAREVATALYPDPPMRKPRLPLIRARVEMAVARGAGDPLTDAVLSATSNAQKVEVLLEGAKMHSEQAMRAWLQDARAAGVVSEDLAKQFTARRRPAAPVTQPAGVR